MLHLRSVGSRMVLSHILVATLTTIIVWLAFLLLVTFFSTKPTPGDYLSLAALETGYWLAGAPDGLPNPPSLSSGSAIVVGVDGQVLHSFGDTGCRAGVKLAECAAPLAGILPGERQVTVNKEEWAQLVIPLRTGERTIVMYKLTKPELAISVPFLGLISGNAPYVITISIITSVLSIPVALLLAWLLVQPLLNRIKNVTRANQRFARGELETRVQDNYPDEIGELAHQFDDMADGLEQSVVVLRELAQRNAELSKVAETAAIQAERVRLSRDLHDDITQRIFSLSVSSAALPAMIELDPVRATEQARRISTMAEQTLLELRAFLVDLRPSQLIRRGLAEALQAMCDEWSQLHKIPVECSVVLNGTRLPSSVENEIYRVTQESLNNVAKHARANSVQVSLVQGKRQVVLSTTDDGRGFDRAAPGGENKFGLISMRERAQAVGGNLIIESDTTRGTTIRMVLPLERDAS